MNLPVQKDKNIVIIGDIMLDRFHYGKLEDSSKEDPLAKIHKVNSTTENLGGAGNVAMNIKTMNSNPHLISVIGDDSEGKAILRLLKENGLESRSLLIDKSRSTTLKTRLYEDTQIIRFDRETTEDINLKLETQIKNHLIYLIKQKKADGIILQDYNKGVLTKALIKKIVDLANQNHIPVYVDPKKDNFFEYKGISVFKPNLREIGWAMPDLDYRSAAEQIFKHLNCEFSVITMSEEGMFFLCENDSHHAPTLVKDLVDVCGAGDTVISILALTHLSKCNMNEMALISSLAAADVCQKQGVIPIEYDILSESYSSHHKDKVNYDIA